jgi:hypothetical protein
MGGGFIGERALFCDGVSVGDALRKVFGTPGSPAYIAAQSQKQLFYDVANGDYEGRWRDLYNAYLAAGVIDPPGSNWSEYLQTLGAENIITIAQARYDGLSGNKPMDIHTHPAKHNHKVHRKNNPDGSITIDSPFTPDRGCFEKY